MRSVLLVVAVVGCGARVTNDLVSDVRPDLDDTSVTDSSRPSDSRVDCCGEPEVGDASSNRVAAPVITPSGGSYECPMPAIEMLTATPDANIHYTWDGTNPTLASPRYAGPFALWRSTQLKARAFRDGFAPSEVVTVNYTIKLVDDPPPPPTFLPPGGVYSTDPTVTLSSGAAATICYVNGGSYSVPLCGDDGACRGSALTYSGPFVAPLSVFGTKVVAQACIPCRGRSIEVSATYQRE